MSAAGRRARRLELVVAAGLLGAGVSVRCRELGVEQFGHSSLTALERASCPVRFGSGGGAAILGARPLLGRRRRLGGRRRCRRLRGRRLRGDRLRRGAVVGLAVRAGATALALVAAA